MMKRFLVVLLSACLGVAFAEPVSVTLEFPQGLSVGKVPVMANLSGLEGARVSVAVDPGNGYQVAEVQLQDGKGELVLDGVSSSALVTVKVRRSGGNYASSQVYKDGAPLEFVMEDVRSRAAAPWPLLPWAIGMVILGLLAIRGVRAAF
ncbi:MAG: hypothetical protein HC933_23315 [Pleurocapsa sp. SU_196_0]|nr:hypothetical protein [Pleurocapsa sp. SU_196_0]